MRHIVVLFIRTGISKDYCVLLIISFNIVGIKISRALLDSFLQMQHLIPKFSHYMVILVKRSPLMYSNVTVPQPSGYAKNILRVCMKSSGQLIQVSWSTELLTLSRTKVESSKLKVVGSITNHCELRKHLHIQRTKTNYKALEQ